MRWMKMAVVPGMTACLWLGGCGGVQQMMGNGPADMTERLPPQGRPDRHHHRIPGDEPDYAEGAAPAPPQNDGPSEGGRGQRGGGFGPQQGSVSLGSNGADITPHPATPDTEVSYGQNGSQ